MLNRHVLLSLLFLLVLHNLTAQKNTEPPRPSQKSDTVRVIEILNGRYFYFKTIDSATKLQIISGNARIRQGTTLFFADSVVYNEQLNFMQAYGNVHINDADSINIYSQYMQYDGNKKIATFREKVKLSDGNSTLFTNEMDYDMNGKVGTYKNGGRIESKQTTLTSKQGFYYADIKDVYFIGDVKMSDPEVALASDSLLYNTSSQVATFIAPTTIKSGKSIINTREGYYDLKLKKAKFGNRSRMQDSTSTMIADDFAFDDQTGYGEAKGNVQYKDTAQGLLLFGNRVFFNKEKKNFLATEKPVLVVVQEQDSVFIAADTIYSGLMKDLKLSQQGYIRNFDTIKRQTMIPVDTVVQKKDSVVTSETQLQVPSKDSVTLENLNTQVTKDSVKTTTPELQVTRPITDSVTFNKRSTAETDTLRFITAFRNVRIFNDSLQSVCDSLFYSGEDSVFQLYYNPVAWAKESQVTGDTIFIFTENRKPKRLFVFENALMIQKVEEQNQFFNQLKGRTINGYFQKGELDYVEANGTSESIYYALDEDSAYVGMNRTSADRITMHFDNRTAKKVKFTRSVKGTTYPIRKIPEDQKTLRGFQWLEAKRPKSKLELFD